MRRLLIVTAAIELGAGLALLCIPSAAAAAVFGSPLETPASLALGRLAGTALLALGITSVLASRDAQSPAARGFIAAMTLYNVGAGVILGAAGIWLRPIGFLLWPGVALHSVMTGWCVACLLSKPTQAFGAVGR